MFISKTEPYLMVRKKVPSDGKPLVGNEKFEGYCFDLAEKVAEIVKMDYVIAPVKDGNFGGKNKNGKWNGMVGELIRDVSTPQS